MQRIVIEVDEKTVRWPGEIKAAAYSACARMGYWLDAGVHYRVDPPCLIAGPEYARDFEGPLVEPANAWRGLSPEAAVAMDEMRAELASRPKLRGTRP